METARASGKENGARADTPWSPWAAPAPDAGRSTAEADDEYRLLRALLEHSSDMVSVVGADGRLRFHFPPDVLGYEEGANDGRSVFDFVHPDDRDETLERFAALLDSEGSIEPFVCRIRTAAGDWRWMEIVGSNLVHDPVINGFVINSRDVTDRHLAQQLLRRSARRFRSMIQHVSELVLVWDSRGEITYASPATVRFALGHEPADPDTALESTMVFIHADDRPRIERLVVDLFPCPGVSRQTVARFRRHDGEFRSLEVTMTNLLEDETIRGIVANARDVTEHLAFEAALRHQEEWYRRLVQHGYDAIAVVDEAGGIRYLSPAVRKILGYDPEALTAENVASLLHPADSATLVAAFIHARQAAGFHGPIEARARHADGSWRWLEIVLTNQLDDPVVLGIVVNFRDVTERHKIEEQLEHQALHDPLTGLPNRVLLLDRLTQALTRAQRDGARVGVLFLDLDGFKYVNDTRGHGAGDELLTIAAARLAECVRDTDSVARFGGDEFVVVVESISGATELVEFGQCLCTELSRPVQIDGHEIVLTASCGAALVPAGTDPQGVLRDADAAMYAAKDRGGGLAILFDEVIRRRVEVRYDTERALRGALDHNELSLLYQPIVDMETHDTLGVEALLRWHQEPGRVVGPTHFIQLAEETGLIVPIGLWALETACREVAAWRADPDGPEVYASVNLSVAQLRVPDLAGEVAAILDRTGLEPSALMLEITETFLVDDMTACLDRLRALKKLGLRLAVDDFGTRYSSLGYLHRMPLDVLKIDRVFVRRLDVELQTRAIVAAIMAMAGTLGLTVIAEGVETLAHATVLKELGCRFAQGYYFSHPVAPDALLDRERRSLPDAKTRANPSGIPRSGRPRVVSASRSDATFPGGAPARTGRPPADASPVPAASITTPRPR